MPPPLQLRAGLALGLIHSPALTQDSSLPIVVETSQHEDPYSPQSRPLPSAFPLLSSFHTRRLLVVLKGSQPTQTARPGPSPRFVFPPWPWALESKT